MLLSLGLAACGDEDDGDEQSASLNPDWRLGLVLNVGGSIDDGGFSQSAHLGATRAAEEYNLDYRYVSSIDENDYTNKLDLLIEDDRNIIVTVGFEMLEVTNEYAQQYPDVYFVGVDFTIENPPPNFIGLQFSEDEAAFIAGALAGMMTDSGTVAVIGGVDLPPVKRLVTGFRHGAQYVNPDVEVLHTYIMTFGQSEKGVSAATEFLDQGADVIFNAGGPAGSAGIQYAAREGGVWVIGVDQDEWATNFREDADDGSKRVLTSAIKRMDNGVYQAVTSIIEGNFEPGELRLDTASCGVGYAPFHQAADQIPDDTKAMLEAIWRALAAGTLDTGASEPDNPEPPAPLAAGDMPPVPDDAPLPSDCEG